MFHGIDAKVSRILPIKNGADIVITARRLSQQLDALQIRSPTRPIDNQARRRQVRFAIECKQAWFSLQDAISEFRDRVEIKRRAPGRRRRGKLAPSGAVVAEKARCRRRCVPVEKLLAFVDTGDGTERVEVFQPQDLLRA